MICWAHRHHIPFQESDGDWDTYSHASGISSSSLNKPPEDTGCIHLLHEVRAVHDHFLESLHRCAIGRSSGLSHLGATDAARPVAFYGRDLQSYRLPVALARPQSPGKSSTIHDIARSLVLTSVRECQSRAITGSIIRACCL